MVGYHRTNTATAVVVAVVYSVLGGLSWRCFLKCLYNSHSAACIQRPTRPIVHVNSTYLRVVDRRPVSDWKRGYVIATVDRLRDVIQLHLAQFLSSMDGIMWESKQGMWIVEGGDACPTKHDQRPVTLSLTYPPPASAAITSYPLDPACSAFTRTHSSAQDL